jgi:hypothetical protein
MRGTRHEHNLRADSHQAVDARQMQIQRRLRLVCAFRQVDDDWNTIIFQKIEYLQPLSLKPWYTL